MALYFLKFEKNVSKFQKILKKNLDVGNDELYQVVKSQPKTPDILGVTKMTKSDKFGRIEN